MIETPTVEWPKNAPECSNYTILVRELRSVFDERAPDRGSKLLALLLACTVGEEQVTAHEANVF